MRFLLLLVKSTSDGICTYRGRVAFATDATFEATPSLPRWLLPIAAAGDEARLDSSPATLKAKSKRALTDLECCRPDAGQIGRIAGIDGGYRIRIETARQRR